MAILGAFGGHIHSARSGAGRLSSGVSLHQRFEMAGAMQKTGSGEATLYLYRLTPQGFVAATGKPLADLAWAYFKTRPEWRRIRKEPEYHISAGLLKGTEENYRWLGVDWPQNRYLLIGLSGDADVKGRKPMQTGVVNGWRCRYDLETGKFDVPPLFSNDNAKAVVPE